MIKKYTPEEYNLLTPYHLGLEVEKPIEPLEKDYKSHLDYNYNWMMWEKELHLYEFITGGRPEPEWNNDWENRPKDGAKYYWCFEHYCVHGLIGKKDKPYIGSLNPSRSIPIDKLFWADKQTYDNTLALWNMYQRKYEGWIQSNRIAGLTAFFKDDTEVIFSRDNIIIARSSDFKYEARKIKTSLFEIIINQ